MKIIRLIMIYAVSSLLIFTACDSTDPNDDSKEIEVRGTLTTLDATMGGMADIQSSPMLMAVGDIPEGLIDFGFILPQLISSVTPDNLSKNAANGRIFEAFADTTIADILAMLTALYGTHTYTNDQWVSVANLTDEILIIYPFIDPTTTAEHEAKIRMYGISLAETAVGVDLEIFVDNTRQMWISLDVTGTDLFADTAVPNSVEVEGGIVTEDGLTVTFGLTVTNTNLDVTLGVLGNSLVLSVTGDDLFDSLLGDGELMPNSISLGFGEVELVVNNFEVTGLGEDMGDVYYSGNQVGDIIVEEAGLFIVFNNGNKANLADLMPNAFALLGSVEGLPK